MEEFNPELPLQGFTGDLRGSERAILTMLPVLHRQQAPFSPSAYSWTWSNLAPVVGREAEEVELLPEGLDLRLREGEVLWFVGPELFADIENQTRLVPLQSQILSWGHEFRNFRWRVGTQHEFLEFVTHWTNEITPMLRRGLANRRRMMSGETEDLFNLYLSWNTVDDAERLILRVLFFDQNRDSVRKASVARQAAASPHFRNEEDFWAQYEAYKTELVAARIAEVVEAERMRGVQFALTAAAGEGAKSWRGVRRQGATGRYGAYPNVPRGAYVPHRGSNSQARWRIDQ